MWAFNKKFKKAFYERLLQDHNLTDFNDTETPTFFLQMPAGLQQVSLDYTLWVSDPLKPASQLLKDALDDEGTLDVDEIRSLCASYEKDEARLYNAYIVGANTNILWEPINATDFIQSCVLLFIHPDVSIDGDLEDLVPGGAKVFMYHILDRELFVLPNGFEITLTEQKVVDTPFYTQRRSKLEKGPDGSRSCFLGL